MMTKDNFKPYCEYDYDSDVLKLHFDEDYVYSKTYNGGPLVLFMYGLDIQGFKLSGIRKSGLLYSMISEMISAYDKGIQNCLDVINESMETQVLTEEEAKIIDDIMASPPCTIECQPCQRVDSEFDLRRTQFQTFVNPF